MSSPARRSPSTSKSRSPSTSIPKAARSITAQEKAMLSNLNRGLALALAVAVLGGCATSKEKLLPHGDSTMMDIWQQNAGRSEERRVGKECVSTCRSRWAPYHKKKNDKETTQQ